MAHTTKENVKLKTSKRKTTVSRTAVKKAVATVAKKATDTKKKVIVTNKAKKVDAPRTPIGTRVSKTELVAWHLKTNKSITSWSAIDLYGGTRLAAIIHTLRHNRGWRIRSEERPFKDRYGNTEKYALYTLLSCPKKKKSTPKKQLA